jgi:hypothetical protein
MCVRRRGPRALRLLQHCVPKLKANTAAAGTPICASVGKQLTYDRLTASNAAVLFIDQQTGLANGVQTQSPPEFINNVKALVTIAQIYKLPSIITTSAADGPNDPIMPALQKGFPRRRSCIGQVISTRGTTLTSSPP